MTSGISKYSPEYAFSFRELSTPSPISSTTSTSSGSRASTPSRPSSLDMSLILKNSEERDSLESPITQENLPSSPIDLEDHITASAEDVSETTAVTLDAMQFKLWMEMYDRSVRVHDQARKDILLLQTALTKSQEREKELQIALYATEDELELREKNLRIMLSKKDKIIETLQRDLNQMRFAAMFFFTARKLP